MARIYVASSWMNRQQPSLVEELINRGHLVYDFRHPKGRDDRSIWDEIGVTERLHTDGISEPGLTGEELDYTFRDEKANERFLEHAQAMSDADTCILLLPSGRSSHVEAGYMKGLGKRVFVFCSHQNIQKPELMYRVFDGYFYLYQDLFDAIEEPVPGVCRVCGCTNENPCYHPDYGTCYWVEPSLCSHCAGMEEGGLGIKDDPATEHCISDEGDAFKLN